MEKKNTGSSQDKRLEKTQQNKFWLQNQVNDIIEPMMLAVVQKAQESPQESSNAQTVSAPFPSANFILRLPTC